MAKFDGRDNLIPMSRRSKDEARELGRKGGKRSGQVRAFAKNFREAIMQECDKVAANGDANGYEMAATALMREIADGNVQAMRLLADVTGQIKQQHEFDVSLPPIDIEVIGGAD